MTEPESSADALLARARATSSRSAKDPIRVADMIEEHRLLQEQLTTIVAYLRGFRETHRMLIALVHAMLSAIYRSSNGRADWTTEIPPGRAPDVRRALNALRAFLRGDAR